MHTAVLSEEVLSYFSELSSRAPKLALDCTLGGGGHAARLLELDPELSMVGLDCDNEAVRRCLERFGSESERIVVLQANFGDAISALEARWFEISQQLQAGEGPLGAFGFILADLGYSSFQIEAAERGLSFQLGGPLDMRLNQQTGETAADILNRCSEREIVRMLRRGGVGSEASAVAKEIVRSRPLSTTSDLSAACERSVPKARRTPGRNPATTIFQAVRIEVNNEFGVISALLESAPKLLASGGRLAVISFHSLEDRLVARAMRGWQRSTTPSKLPIKAAEDTIGKLLTSSAVVPAEQEISSNPRARSARLRVFEKH